MGKTKSTPEYNSKIYALECKTEIEGRMICAVKYCEFWGIFIGGGKYCGLQGGTRGNVEQEYQRAISEEVIFKKIRIHCLWLSSESLM